MTLLLLRKYWKVAAGAVLLAAMLWAIHSYGSRRYSAGAASVQARWHADILSRTTAENKRLAAYQTQVTEAENEAAKNRATLADLRHAPIPRLRCTSQTLPSPVRDSPGPAVEPAGTGQLQEAVEFDPAPALYAEADRADDTIEACRVAIGKWPR